MRTLSIILLAISVLFIGWGGQTNKDAITELRTHQNQLDNDLALLKVRLDQVKQQLDNLPLIIERKVRITHYAPTGQGSSSGMPLIFGETCAVSPDLWASLHLLPGDKVLIPGMRSKRPDGLWVVVDRTANWIYRTVDLYMPWTEAQFCLEKRVMFARGQ